MTEIQVTDVSKFVQAFRTAYFSEQFEQIKEKYRDTQRLARQTSPQFNIFRVLGVDHREVKTHSAFLAELLDPTGSHDQEFVFLKAFLQHCQKKQAKVNESSPPKFFPTLPDDIEPYQWHIRKERSTKVHGRLDIVIQCKDLGFLCAIENKVDALESERQLKFYWDWMQTHKMKCDRQALIFLTPVGRLSQSAGDVPYFPLSYHKDIYEWLSVALQNVESPSLRPTINQYLQLILRLG